MKAELEERSRGDQVFYGVIEFWCFGLDTPEDPENL